MLDHLADGLTGEEIAARLSLSPLTIRTHIRNAMGKLRANTRAHAVALALRRGELSLDGRTRTVSEEAELRAGR